MPRTRTSSRARCRITVANGFPASFRPITRSIPSGSAAAGPVSASHFIHGHAQAFLYADPAQSCPRCRRRHLSAVGESEVSMMAIGKPLILSPAFPPPHTVHAAFTAHGVPPNKLRLVVIAPPGITPGSILRPPLFSTDSAAYLLRRHTIKVDNRIISQTLQLFV